VGNGLPCDHPAQYDTAAAVLFQLRLRDRDRIRLHYMQF
jgi:hypothetical protein